VATTDRQRFLRLLAAAATTVLTASLWPAAAQAAQDVDRAGTRTVSFRDVSVTVPEAWPVHRLSGRPGCVRFDRHAVYLGDPSRSTCPPHLVGRTEAVHLTTGSLQGVVSPDRVVTAEGSPVGVVVAAGDDTPGARAIASSVRFEDAPAEITTPSGRVDARNFASSDRATSDATSTPSSSRSPSDTRFSGLGFDACTAQPLTTMATWYNASPYKASNMYIGGASRGCGQPNLTADWVAQTIAQGWTLIPTYVGLQASCSDYENRIVPAQAAAQGVAAADDAIVQLNALGLGGGNPVYFDIEAFSYTNATCLSATRTFLGAWTQRLHDRGYVSGIYSSSNALAATVFDGTTKANRVPTAAMPAPDALWFARWPANSQTQEGDPTLTDAAIPDQYLTDHQRIHQYRGGHQETWGGVTVNIDNDSVDAPVAPYQLAPEGAFVASTAGGWTYRIAGGAPIPITSWAAVGGEQPVQTLSPSQFASLPARPREGTFLQSGATGRIWRVVKGVATYVPSWTPYGGPKPAVVIDQAALDNAGTGSVWNHLASGTPTVRTTGPTTLGTAAPRGRFTWTGGITSSAISNYDVRWRKARWDGTFGDWTRPTSWQHRTQPAVSHKLLTGYTYCVSVRARNRAGQLSGWTGGRCLARALDDRSLSRSSGWSAKSSAGYLNGTFLFTRQKGATLSRTSAKVRRVGLVAGTCRACGKVAVLIDGKRIGTVNLAGSKQKTKVFMLPAFGRHKATVTLRVRSSGAPVRIDGLVLSRT
jgi:hypothetical protein